MLWANWPVWQASMPIRQSKKLATVSSSLAHITRCMSTVLRTGTHRAVEDIIHKSILITANKNSPRIDGFDLSNEFLL